MKKLLLATLVFMGACQQTQGSFVGAIAAAKIAGSWSVANLPKALLTSVAFGIGQYVANQPAIEQAGVLALECSNAQQSIGSRLNGLEKAMAPAMALADKQMHQHDGWWGLAKYGYSEVATAYQMILVAISVYASMKNMGAFSQPQMHQQPEYAPGQYQQQAQLKALRAGKQAQLVC